jgi:dolichol-phosphate mannosyltransferase
VLRALVVMPTYNEAENIDEVLRKVRVAVPDGDVLIVDDGSPDGTADLADELGEELGHITVLRRTEKNGLGAAYRAGFRWGLDEGYEALVEMDSDLSHDPAALPSLLVTLDAAADLVIGSRYVPGGAIPEWSWHRRFLSRWGGRYSAGMLGLAVNDPTAGYRAYRATMLRQIDLDEIESEGYTFQIEMTYAVVQRGGRIVEVPISFTDRVRGTSKMSSRIVVEALSRVTWWAVRDKLLGGARRRRRRALAA